MWPFTSIWFPILYIPNIVLGSFAVWDGPLNYIIKHQKSNIYKPPKTSKTSEQWSRTKASKSPNTVVYNYVSTSVFVCPTDLSPAAGIFLGKNRSEGIKCWYEIPTLVILQSLCWNMWLCQIRWRFAERCVSMEAADTKQVTNGEFEAQQSEFLIWIWPLPWWDSGWVVLTPAHT